MLGVCNCTSASGLAGMVTGGLRRLDNSPTNGSKDGGAAAGPGAGATGAGPTGVGSTGAARRRTNDFNRSLDFGSTTDTVSGAGCDVIGGMTNCGVGRVGSIFPRGGGGGGGGG